MRIFVVCLLCAIALTSVVSAEILTVANPVGKGKLAFEAVGLSEGNFDNCSTWTMNTLGIKAAYGVTDQLELDVAYGIGNTGGTAPIGISSVSLSPLMLIAKYGILNEINSPVSLSLIAGYKVFTAKTTVVGGATASSDCGKSGAGILVSKVYSLFVPYGCLGYSTQSTAGILLNFLDLTLGTGIAFSKQGMAFIEYTNQAITDSGVNYTSPQIGVGVSYTL